MQKSTYSLILYLHLLRLLYALGCIHKFITFYVWCINVFCFIRMRCPGLKGWCLLGRYNGYTSVCFFIYYHTTIAFYHHFKLVLIVHILIYLFVWDLVCGYHLNTLCTCFSYDLKLHFITRHWTYCSVLYNSPKSILSMEIRSFIIKPL